jgi:hypothetical protein
MPAALPPCSGRWAHGGRDHLRYLGRTLDTYVCVGPSTLRVEAFDAASGERVDRRALKDADLAAFEDGARLHHSLRDMLHGLDAEALVDVAIWLRVEQEDLPDTEAQREDAALAVYAHEVREERMRASVLALAEALEAFPGAVLRANLDAGEIGIPAVFARVPRRHLAGVGRLPGVNLVMPGSPDEDPVPLQSQSVNYFDSNVAWVHHAFGYTGNGITVAVCEGRPDSYWNLPGIAPGDCVAEGGSAHCHCPSDNVTGHGRTVTGLISNSVTPFGGIAPGATTIFANPGTSQDCKQHGLNQATSALNWATNEGASVLNFSMGVGEVANMFWDYKAVTWPFPTVVAGAGNGGHLDVPVSNRLRNGLVVGAASENHLDYAVHTRHDAIMRPQSSWLNPEGWGELPHLVAPGTNVATAGFELGAIVSAPGTSFATPQVSAAAACIQEQNPALKMRPEAIISGLMVGADINVDANDGGVWPLNLHDAIDDRDGAGLMNIWHGGGILDEWWRREPFQPGSIVGHDYGTIAAVESPAGTVYQAFWVAHVPAGATLRAHFILMSDPNCQASHIGSCLGNPYPESALLLYHEPTERYDFSNRLDQNWQYVSIHNASAVDEEWFILVGVIDWNGIASRPFALSWNTLEPMGDPSPWL